MRRLFLAALASTALAGAAHAQVGIRPLRSPGFRPGIVYANAVSSLTGPCGTTPSGFTPGACIDPANGVYSLDGTTNKGSVAAAGGTQPADCTITAGTGVSCTATNSGLTFPVTNPSTDVFLVLDDDFGANGSVGAVLGANASTASLADYWSPASSAGHAGLIGGFNSTAGTGTKIAICTTGSGGFVSVAGGAATSPSSAQAGPAANTTLVVGGGGGGAYPSSARTRYARILTGKACTAANAQAAAT